MERFQTVDVGVGEIRQYQTLRLRYYMVDLLEDFFFRPEVATDEVCSSKGAPRVLRRDRSISAAHN